MKKINDLRVINAGRVDSWELFCAQMSQLAGKVDDVVKRVEISSEVKSLENFKFSIGNTWTGLNLTFGSNPKKGFKFSFIGSKTN